MKKTLIFDYDGTIHETLRIYEPAMRNCVDTLIAQGILPNQTLTTKQISSWLGMSAKAMWQEFAPSLEQQLRDQASAMVGEHLEKLVKEGKARWYPGAEETLDMLKEMGYTMVILSNSKKKTGTLHFEYFRMKRWFDAWYDCESYDWKPKTEIIFEIQKKYGNELVVIGDRGADLEAAMVIGAPFVGCLYGYGTGKELEDATWQIRDIKELVPALKRIQ